MTASQLALFEAALASIAAIPLWGESITDADLRDAFVQSHKYDLAADCYEPCCDTESSYLDYAVSTARMALQRGGAR